MKETDSSKVGGDKAAEQLKLVKALFSTNVEQETEGKFTKIKRAYSVDLLERFDAALTVRLWMQVGADVFAVLVGTEKGIDAKPYVASIAYVRDDATKAIGAQAIGLTVLIASPLIKGAPNCQIVLVLSSGEVMQIKGQQKTVSFHELLNGIGHDVARTGKEYEAYTYTKTGSGVVDSISGAWQLYLASIKKNYALVDLSKGRVKYSIITVFYRNKSLAAMYPLLTRVIDLGGEYELVMCFQESAIFKSQIEWIIQIAKRTGINLKVLMFEENIGFSAGNNLGVDACSGSVVMLLNPDILCSDTKIYGELFHQAEKRNAIVGSTLLGTSGDVMHNGIDFDSDIVIDGGRTLQVARTFHISRHSPAKAIKQGTVKQVPAISGAVIVVKKSLWRELGGLSEKYVFAHFEDMDFCLHAKNKGVLSVVYQNTSLTHIESYSSGETGVSRLIKLTNSNIYNRVQMGI